MKEKITIWCNKLDDIENLWHNSLMNAGWDVKEPIKVKFNWRKFQWQYKAVFIK